MGPHSAAFNVRDLVLEATQITPAGFGAPSPASEDLCLTSPSLDRSMLASPTPLFESQPALASEPDVVKVTQVSTPLQETRPDLGFDAIVGAAVDPAPSHDLCPLPAAKSGPGLRLPSFAQLGIEAPHSAPLSGEMCTKGPVSLGSLSSCLPLPFEPESAASQSDMYPHDDGHEEIENQERSDGPKAAVRLPSVPNPLRHYATTLTPPDDEGNITWEQISKFAVGPLGTPALSSGLDASNSGEFATGDVSGAPQIKIQNTDNSTYGPGWINEAIQTMLTTLHSSNQISNPLKVLSHALPSPSTEGHIFPIVISSLHDQTPASPTCWINVFHALPGRFNLGDLPTSPPSTPGQPGEGEDYFTTKIFDSAVQIMDYQESIKSLPASPRPVVPPSSVDVSIVERYIPPTNVNEFTEMFNTKGPSLLVDRLVELSPGHGSLIFIYPTKRGAETFMNEYLGPILDPILRSMVVVNGFSADVSSSLGRMAAVESLPDHETMKRKIQRLCNSLGRISTSTERFHKRQAEFEIVHATQEEVMLDRKVWARDWWCRQEKPRIREVIQRCFRVTNRAEDNKSPAVLIHEVLDGVAGRPYRDGLSPQSGIEVSIFVIKRSK
ncbi:hypothetical protein MBLNU459_g7257t1 [Dothideomycetes sp. NU459]